jgi:LacI family transcriptional regulator
MTALGALRAMKKKGVRVPEDCSVVGFDDVPQAAISVPALSTVRQPMEVMGTLSVGIVLDAINAVRQKRDVPIVRRRVPAELVTRESTRQVSK